MSDLIDRMNLRCRKDEGRPGDGVSGVASFSAETCGAAASPWPAALGFPGRRAIVHGGGPDAALTEFCHILCHANELTHVD